MIIKIFIVFTLYLNSFCLFAQDELSLIDAIEIALNNNYQIQISEKSALIANRNNNWLEAGILPTINVQGGYDYNWNNNNNPSSYIQGKSVYTQTGLVANLNWTIFNGFKVKIAKDKLQQLKELGDGNAAIIVENTIHSIILGYSYALLQHEKLVALANTVTFSKDKLKVVEERKKKGEASLFDILQAETTLYSDSSNMVMQELAFNNAIRNLNILMATDVERTYLLTDRLEFISLKYDILEMKNKMLSNSQTLKNQLINQKMIRADVGLARTNLLPVLSFNLGTNYSTSTFDGKTGFGVPVSTSGNRNLTVYAGLSLSYTIINGGKNYRAFKNLKIDSEIAELTKEEMELTMTGELISLHELYKTRIEISRMMTKNMESGGMFLKMANQKFLDGSLSFFELREVQMTQLTAVVAELESMYEVISAHTDLVRITGGMIEEFKGVD